MNLPPALPRTLFCGLLASLPILAQGANFHANVMLDEYDGICDAHCSLRDAVSAANQRPGKDIIRLSAGVYQLTLPPPLDAKGIPYDEDANLNGDLDVTDILVIQGVNVNDSSISGLGASTVPPYDRLLEVRPGASLTLRRLTLENGRTAYTGGGVENHGRLNLLDTLLRRNAAHTANPDFEPIVGEDAYRRGQGGGIANYGELVVNASRFVENNAVGDLDYNEGRGGAIFNRGQLWVRDSGFTRNLAADEMEWGTGAAIYNDGTADIARSEFFNNRGAEGTRGFAIANVANGRLLLSNSTLSGHFGTNGAITNGDRFGNRDPEGYPQAVLRHVTIANNGGYGVRNSGALLIRNSVIAGNLGIFEDEVTNCINDGDQYLYQARGLVLNSEPSNCTGELALPYEDTFTELLQPLANNGGPTQTFALQPGSLAIDAAIDNCPRQDQRRVARPQDGDGDGIAVCDLGAYEQAAP